MMFSLGKIKDKKYKKKKKGKSFKISTATMKWKYIFFSFFVLLCNISYQYFLKFREQIIKAHNPYHL